MTVTSDPHDPLYLDEADVRAEMSRVFDVCDGCRRCTDLCGSFPTLFALLDRHGDHDAGRLTPAQQDLVVDQCFQCKLCKVGCPYAPERSEAAVDVPRLMLRADAMRYATGQQRLRARVTTQVMSRTELLGRVGTLATGPANRIMHAKRRGATRAVLEKLTGLSRRRLAPTFAAERFSKWFARRPRVRIGRRHGRVALFPTCLVEYLDPAIGQDLVKVYERNGIEVGLADVGCCGAPWLHAGDRERFVDIASRNVDRLASEVRAGNDVVVPQPTCSWALREDYPAYCPGADADLVAAHTFDASEYLMKVHREPDTSLDMGFNGDVPASITYHTPPHLRAQDVGLRSRDLLKLTGAPVRLVQRASANEAMWGLRAENAQRAIGIAAKLATEVADAGGEVIAGDCLLANTAIEEQTGRRPVHPLQVIARAYGIAPEDASRR